MRYLVLILMLALTACGDDPDYQYSFNLKSTPGIYYGEGTLYDTEMGTLPITAMVVRYEEKYIKVDYITDVPVTCTYSKVVPNPDNNELVIVLGEDERPQNIQRLVFMFDQVGYDNETKIKNYMVRVTGVGGSSDDICNTFFTSKSFQRDPYMIIK